MRKATIWDLDRTLVPRMAAMIREGLSFRAIAVHLGISRSAAMGKARRLNLMQPEKKALDGKRDQFMPPSPSKEPTPMLEPPKEERKGVRLVDTIGNQCRWVLDDYSEPTVCGDPGFPWCKAHARIVYPPRKERAA